MNQNQKPIGIFDSGLGGLTVFQEVRKALPNEDIIYFGDSGRAPYGTKSQETVRRYTASDIEFLMSMDVKAIVVACNTAAAASGKEFLKSFGIPIVDVIGAGSRDAVSATKNGKIGVIATSATVSSGVYVNAIRELLPTAEVKAKTCSLFVPLVEEGWWDREVTKMVAHEYLSEITGIDTLVLGCTHYPYLYDVIKNEVGEHVTIVNSAKSVAKNVCEVISSLNIQNAQSENGKVSFYTSDSVEKFKQLGGLFLGELPGEVKNISLDRLTIK